MDFKPGLSKGTTQRAQYLALWLSFDFVIIILAYTVAFFSRSVLAESVPNQSAPAIIGSAAVTLLGMYFFGVYQRIWTHTSGHSVMVIVSGVVVATIAISTVNLLITPRPLPISVPIMGSVLALVGLVAVRYRSRLISGLSWRWRAIWHQEFPERGTRVMIVGAGESGQDLAWRLRHRFPENNYQIIGFIDDDPHKHHMYVEGCLVLGGREKIVEIADFHHVDLIVVAIHNITGGDFREIISLCEKTQARIKVLPDLYELVRKPQSSTLLRDIQPEDLLGRSTVSRHKDVDMSPVTGKVILITGAAGSIGSELSRQIMDYEPVKVILLDNNESGLHDLVVELRAAHPHIEMEPALVDIAVHEPLRRVFHIYKPQIVFHAAAYKHVPMLQLYPLEALRVNVKGTLNLAEMAVNHDVERFVLVSTDKAVKPSNIMGASKRIGELLLHALSLEPTCHTLFAAVRFGNVLGSRGSVIPTFNRQIDNGGPVTVTHADMTRFFMSIPEAVNLIIHAGCLTQGDEIFVLKMGEEVRILDLAERMIRLRGLRPYKDIDIHFTGIRPGEKMHEELFYDSENPAETRHPNIVKLNNWPQDFDSMAYFDQIVQLVVNCKDASSTDILVKLMDAIENPHVHHVNGKVSETI
jgi:FlaA1/EpsC-like NDP-sugar epimerase